MDAPMPIIIDSVFRLPHLIGRKLLIALGSNNDYACSVDFQGGGNRVIAGCSDGVSGINISVVRPDTGGVFEPASSRPGATYGRGTKL